MRFFKIGLDSLIKIQLLSKQKPISSKKHPTRITSEYIMYVVTDGILQIENNGKAFDIKRGEVAIFASGDYQRPRGDAECSYYFVHFESEKIEIADIPEGETNQSVLEKKARRLRLNSNNNIEKYSDIYVILPEQFKIESTELFEKTVNTLASSTVNFIKNTPKTLLGASAAFANLLLSLEEADKACRGSNGVSENIYRTVKEIARYIEQHYRGEATTDNIAKEFFINPDYAGRIFKKVMGIGITRYRNGLRIKDAKRLLVSTVKSLDEIAEEVGFSDKFYFSKIFKNYEGISPLTFRKNAFMIKDGSTDNYYEY